MIAKLPKPFKLQVFSVIFYPGTSLHTLASRDGLISDERAEIYDKMYFEKNDNYLNTLLYLARSGRFPPQLLEALVDEINALLQNVQKWLRQNHLLLKRSLDLMQDILQNVFPSKASPKTYGRQGAVSPVNPPPSTLYEGII